MEPPKPPKSFPWWAVAAAVAVVLIAGGVIGYFVMRGGEEMVKVPAINGVALNQADQMLTQAGLKQGRVLAGSVRGVASGAIIKSQPPQGAEVARGSAVELFVNFVSSNPAVQIVPGRFHTLNAAQVKMLMVRPRGLEPAEASPGLESSA